MVKWGRGGWLRTHSGCHFERVFRRVGLGGGQVESYTTASRYEAISLKALPSPLAVGYEKKSSPALEETWCLASSSWSLYLLRSSIYLINKLPRPEPHETDYHVIIICRNSVCPNLKSTCFVHSCLSPLEQ